MSMLVTYNSVINIHSPMKNYTSNLPLFTERSFKAVNRTAAFIEKARRIRTARAALLTHNNFEQDVHSTTLNKTSISPIWVHKLAISFDRVMDAGIMDYGFWIMVIHYLPIDKNCMI